VTQQLQQLDDYRNGLYVGAADGWIYKVNLNADHTSANLVRYTFVGSETMSRPSVLLLIGTPHVFATKQSGGDGTIHCLAADVGQIKWSAAVGPSISVPTIDQDGNVYFGSTRKVVYSSTTREFNDGTGHLVATTQRCFVTPILLLLSLLMARCS
jgi:outer membrane protein assembly factor BamB